MRPRILVYIHYLEIGGAERALLGLLHAFDPERVDVDLFVNQHTGEFMPLIPPHVRLLPELPEYSAVERPIVQIVKEGHLMIAARRLLAKRRHGRYHATLAPEQAAMDKSIFQYVFRAVEPSLRPLSYLGHYDLAISFLHPHNIVAHKVDASRKLCWIHTDYSTIHVNHDLELPVWQEFDHVVSISDDVTANFVKTFPELAPKIIEIENIISPKLIRSMADAFDPSVEMPPRPGGVNLLSVGRFSVAKRFEEIPRMCRYLVDRGVDVRWYIVGFGPQDECLANIERYDIADRVVLLGKKSNPYPYIRACDVYVQPSRYEGKSVTVREAQILGRPVVVSDFPTAKATVNDGVDGIIMPFDIDEGARALLDFINSPERRNLIADNLAHTEFSNDHEVDKIYSLIQASQGERSY